MSGTAFGSPVLSTTATDSTGTSSTTCTTSPAGTSIGLSEALPSLAALLGAAGKSPAHALGRFPGPFMRGMAAPCPAPPSSSNRLPTSHTSSSPSTFDAHTTNREATEAHRNGTEDDEDAFLTPDSPSRSDPSPCPGSFVDRTPRHPSVVMSERVVTSAAQLSTYLDQNPPPSQVTELSLLTPINDMATRLHQALYRATRPSVSNASKPVSLADFDMRETLGTGTFGVARLAFHRPSSRFMCIKVLSKRRVIELKQQEHVRNERIALDQCRNPFVVQLEAAFQDRENLYFVMEYVPGGELFTQIKTRDHLSESMARFYAAEIVVALEHLHVSRVAHRDLKPENILLDAEGHIKLVDFGFAKTVADKTFTMCGTPEYIAPEIVMGRGHDTAVDWWSLGVLIFEMLTGKPPFQAESTFKLFERIITANFTLPDTLSPEAADLLRCLLVPDITKRLGNQRRGALDVQDHPWFAGVDWNAVRQRRATPPMIPVLSGDGDTRNYTGSAPRNMAAVARQQELQQHARQVEAAKRAMQPTHDAGVTPSPQASVSSAHAPSHPVSSSQTRDEADLPSHGSTEPLIGSKRGRASFRGPSVVDDVPTQSPKLTQRRKLPQ